jgi:hypothetical protein
MVFLVLVLANMLLAGWGFRARTDAGPGAAIVNQQIQPERIRLISPAEAERMAAPKAVPTSCLEWGAFAAAELPKAVETIEALGVKTRERRVEDAARWWVVIPPFATRAAAGARLAELRKQGVDELYVIDEDALGMRNGISLGLFRTEEGARTRLDALARRGVAGARVVPREATVRVYLQVREAPEALRGRAADLKSAWPAADLRDCPADARN